MIQRRLSYDAQVCSSRGGSRALVFLAILLGGCISVTPAAEHVRVTRNPNQVATCTSLGEIYASSGWGGMVAGPGFENNKRQLANEAAELGGDTLLLLSERGGYNPQTFGEAYRCGDAKGVKP